MTTKDVIPAKAGIQSRKHLWTPASAGVTAALFLMFSVLAPLWAAPAAGSGPARAASNGPASVRCGTITRTLRPETPAAKRRYPDAVVVPLSSFDPANFWSMLNP